MLGTHHATLRYTRPIGAVSPFLARWSPGRCASTRRSRATAGLSLPGGGRGGLACLPLSPVDRSLARYFLSCSPPIASGLEAPLFSGHAERVVSLVASLTIASHALSISPFFDSANTVPPRPEGQCVRLPSGSGDARAVLAPMMGRRRAIGSVSRFGLERGSNIIRLPNGRRWSPPAPGRVLFVPIMDGQMQYCKRKSIETSDQLDSLVFTEVVLVLGFSRICVAELTTLIYTVPIKNLIIFIILDI
jgi:hypothetical protein